MQKQTIIKYQSESDRSVIKRVIHSLNYCHVDYCCWIHACLSPIGNCSFKI